MRHKGSVFARLSLLITLCRRVKTRDLTSRTWHTTSALERQQTVWTQSTPGKGKLGNDIPCCTQGYTYIHIYTCSSLNLLPPSPTLHKKHLERATPACQSRGLKPPDHWCRWMGMDNRQDTRDAERDWKRGGITLHAAALPLRGACNAAVTLDKVCLIYNPINCQLNTLVQLLLFLIMHAQCRASFIISVLSLGHLESSSFFFMPCLEERGFPLPEPFE